MPRYVEAVQGAEIISEKMNIPLADLVDVFADIPTADVAPKSEVAREIFKEILTIIRSYEFDALVAKENYGIIQVRNFGTDILKLAKKYTEERENDKGKNMEEP